MTFTPTANITSVSACAPGAVPFFLLTVGAKTPMHFADVLLPVGFKC